MAHIFPPKAFKPQELPDPTALDSVITPIAEKIWGKINEQDINAVTTGTFPLSVIDPLSGTGSDEGAYTSKHLKFKEVSPGFGATTANPPWFNYNANMAVIDYTTPTTPRRIRCAFSSLFAWMAQSSMKPSPGQSSSPTSPDRCCTRRSLQVLSLTSTTATSGTCRTPKVSEARRSPFG